MHDRSTVLDTVYTRNLSLYFCLDALLHVCIIVFATKATRDDDEDTAGHLARAVASLEMANELSLVISKEATGVV